MSLKQKILDKIRRCPNGATLEEILDGMNIMPHVLIPELDKLVGENEVRKEDLFVGSIFHVERRCPSKDLHPRRHQGGDLDGEGAR